MTDQPRADILSSRGESIILILRPSMEITSSDENVESVLIAFDVVMFDRFAISSLDRYALMVFPSAS